MSRLYVGAMPNIGLVEVIFVIVMFAVAHAVARVADRKGYSFPLFFAFAFFLWLIALIIVLLLLDKREPTPSVAPPTSS